MAKKTKPNRPAPAERPGTDPRARSVRSVILPVLRKVDNVPLYVEFVSAMRTSTVKARVSKDKDGEKSMKPATVAEVINLETGEHANLICNTVLESNLTETYPGEGYVGKQFKIIQYEKAEGKRYKTFEITEIEWNG